MRYTAIFAGLALVGAAGCSDFLNSPKAVLDPNQPSSANRNQLLPGVEAQVMDQQEGGAAMAICEWMQQCAGTNNRFVEEYFRYNVTASSFDANFNSVYTRGGLVSLREIQRTATADGDLVYRGVSEVLEALQVSFAADIWGDIPYSQAADPTITTPKYDGQLAVYDALQTLLDKAIADLAGTGSGPGAFDVLYGGNKTKYTELAYTLKARLYLHTVEKLGTGQYTKAIAAAQKGISTPANDFRAVHTANTSERNLWAQFQLTSFGADLVAGDRLVNLMKADGDPRLAEYFGKNTAGGYGGSDPAGLNDPATISPLQGSGRTDNVTFPQPIVTWLENQLILAEANFVLSGAAAAQPFFNAERASVGKAVKPATLQGIMEDKYMNMFQNVETFNDFKRSCYPRLTPSNPAFAVVPGRFLYGTTEAQTNKDNKPTEGPLQTFRNPNDPNACPTS